MATLEYKTETRLGVHSMLWKIVDIARLYIRVEWGSRGINQENLCLYLALPLYLQKCSTAPTLVVSLKGKNAPASVNIRKLSPGLALAHTLLQLMTRTGNTKEKALHTAFIIHPSLICPPSFSLNVAHILTFNQNVGSPSI